MKDNDDAERYCGLLEAQDFPKPSIEKLDKDEIEQFCLQSGYESRLVVKGFIPQTEEERLLISPPQRNIDSIINDSHKDQGLESNYSNPNDSEEINSFRQSLEDLI